MRALVVGYGSIGKRHIDNLSSFPGMEIIVYTKRKSDKFLQNKNCRTYSTLEECIAKKPDIAIIANVTTDHVDSASKLARAGVNLLVEKPLSNSLTGLKDLLYVVQRKKLVTLVGCNMRFHPCIQKIRDLLYEKNIGEVISVRAENGSYLPYWHPNEDYSNSYAARKDLGGGALLTNIHEIDYLYWFFGRVKEVFSFTGKFSNLNVRADDMSSILLRFRNGVIGEIHLDYFQRPSYRGCKIIGTKGTIYWDSESNIVRTYDIINDKWIERIKLSNFDINYSYVEELRHFIKCVNKKQKSINTLSDAKKTLEIALAAKKASETKKVIKIN